MRQTFMVLLRWVRKQSPTFVNVLNQCYPAELFAIMEMVSTCAGHYSRH